MQLKAGMVGKFLYNKKQPVTNRHKLLSLPYLSSGPLFLEARLLCKVGI